MVKIGNELMRQSPRRSLRPVEFSESKLGGLTRSIKSSSLIKFYFFSVSKLEVFFFSLSGGCSASSFMVHFFPTVRRAAADTGSMLESAPCFGNVGDNLGSFRPSFCSAEENFP